MLKRSLVIGGILLITGCSEPMTSTGTGNRSTSSGGSSYDNTTGAGVGSTSTSIGTSSSGTTAGSGSSPTSSGTGSSSTSPASGASGSSATGVNTRDRNDSAKTPIDQNENQADISTTANIRKRLVSSDMSTYAQNVKIMTQEGRVTLRGPVSSDEEKQQIEQIAKEVAGEGQVVNQLEVSVR